MGLLGRIVDLKAVDGLLVLGWHGDQLHRLGAGPAPDRSTLATFASLIRRNSRTILRLRRS